MGKFWERDRAADEPEEGFAPEERAELEFGEQEATDGKTEPEHENVLRLSRPLELPGTQGALTELEYDFDELTAADLHRVSKDLKHKGIPVTVIALDYEFQISTFAKAVGKVNHRVTLANILSLSAHDAMRAAALARDFLVAADPSSTELGSGD